jgi:AraC family transcriptional regulator
MEPEKSGEEILCREEWFSKGAAMIEILNRLIDAIEKRIGDDIDIEALAAATGTTGYHARRMFSSLAGIPVSEYVRRRRMTVASADVVGEEDFLTIAIRYGYGSTEAFGRAFLAVHGVSHGDARRDGGPLRNYPQLRFRLTVEGSVPMDARIIKRPAFRLIGHALRVPLIHEGINPHIQQHIASLPVTEHERLMQLSATDPAGLLQVSAEVDPDYTEGTELTYLHGVAVDAGTAVPDDLDAIEVEEGTWVVFHTSGEYPSALQAAYAASATEWFPSNPWRLRPGPSIVAVLERTADFSTATCDLWFPIERA